MTSSSGLGAWTEHDINYADRLMRTYAQIAHSQPVIDQLVDRLGLDHVPDYEVEPVLATELLTITVEDGDPALAAETANVLAEILIEQQEMLYSGDTPTAASILFDRLTQLEGEIQGDRAQYDGLVIQLPAGDPQLDSLIQSINLRQDLYNSLVTQYEDARTAEQLRENTMYQVEPASVPSAPSKPNKIINLVLGGMVGLLGGCGLALLLYRLDSRVYDIKDIVRIVGAPLIGEIPRLHKPEQNPIYSGDTVEGEAFRRLYANCSLRTFDRNAPKRTLLFVSATPEAGKSTTVANLAVAFAQAKHRVLLIDADLHRPKIYEYLGISNDVGLYDFLTGEDIAVEDVLQHYLETGQDPVVFIPGTNGSSHTVSLNHATAQELMRLPGVGAVSAEQIVEYRDSVTPIKSIGDLPLTGIPGKAFKQIVPYASDHAAVLDVIPSGQAPADDIPMLNSAALQMLLAGLRTRYDVILINSPAFMAVNTAILLASVADGVVIVVRSATARVAQLQAMREQLAAAGVPIVGVVSNQVPTLHDYAYYRSRHASGKAKPA